MENIRYVLSYSCGKDSTLALHRLHSMGIECEALIVTVDDETGKSFFHGVPECVLEKIEESLEIPMIKMKIGKDNYREVFVNELKNLAKKGIMVCVFGDIDIEDHREWCRSVCKEAGIVASFPLWQEDRESLVGEFIRLGYEGIIKVVNKKYLDEDFLGKVLDYNLIDSIVSKGADSCGENGEYHTIVVDGPLFKKKVEIEINGIISDENYGSISI